MSGSKANVITLRFLCSFRGIGPHTALGLIAEIGDFRRFSHPRELMSYLGLTPSEYSSGDQQHRGHITKTEIATPGGCSFEAAGTTSTPRGALSEPR